MQLNKVFHDWLNRRKITDKVIEDFNLHDAVHYSIGECIAFPVHNGEGNFLYNKYRRSPLDLTTPKYLYDKGGSVELYGWFKAKNEKTILITEGEADCLVAWSHNIPAVTSTGGALSFQKEWANLFTDKEVILAFDNDPAGGEGMVKTLSIIPHAKVLFIPDRAGVKDVSDYVASGGDLIELIKSAKLLNTLELVKEDRGEKIAKWQSHYFHDAYIKEYEKSQKVGRTKNTSIETNKVMRAKEYPITNLLEFKQGKAICPFHNEKTGSLHYYQKTNTCYCFGGCGRVYDSIDIYRQLYNCTFKHAVEKLQ